VPLAPYNKDRDLVRPNHDQLWREFFRAVAEEYLFWGIVLLARIMLYGAFLLFIMAL